MIRSKSIFRWLVVLVAILLFTAACSLTSSSAANAAPTATPDNVIGQDDFSNTSSGWEIGQYDTGEIGYKDNTYFVTSTVQNKAMWGASKDSYQDVMVEVDSTQISAPENDNNDYGVMCRVQDSGDGYSFLISGDGQYSIQKSTDGEFISLVDWAKSSEIKTGNASNHIVATCKGSKLTLVVNGSQLAEVEDTTFTSGRLGLTATTYETTGTEIHFDNLVLRRP